MLWGRNLSFMVGMEMINFDNLKKGDLVLVTWQDCASHGAIWCEEEDMDIWVNQENNIKTVGWIHGQSKDWLLVYSTHDQEKNRYRMIFELYKPQIIDIQRLIEIGFKENAEVSVNPIRVSPKREHHENCSCLKCKKKKGKT